MAPFSATTPFTNLTIDSFASPFAAATAFLTVNSALIDESSTSLMTKATSKVAGGSTVSPPGIVCPSAVALDDVLLTRVSVSFEPTFGAYIRFSSGSAPGESRRTEGAPVAPTAAGVRRTGPSGLGGPDGAPEGGAGVGSGAVSEV